MNVKVKNNDNNSEIDWLLDSGCTDHIINNDKYYRNCIILKEPVNVKVGDGRVLKATKVGTVLMYFQVYGKKEKVNIANIMLEK